MPVGIPNFSNKRKENKMKIKKLIALTLSVATIVSSAVAAQAADFTVGTENGEKGKEVEIPVVVPSGASINGYALKISYDSTVLTPVKYDTDATSADRFAEAGTGFTDGVLVADLIDNTGDTDEIAIGWANGSAVTTTGEAVVKVKFAVASNTTVTSTPVEATMVQFAENADSLSTNYTVVAGAVVLGGDVLYGDVDLNNAVEATDANLVLRHSVSQNVLTDPLALQAADVDGNGKVEATDANYILRRVVNASVVFPAENN